MKKEKSISSNIFQTFVVQIPNYILGIAAGIFITRQLGPEGKGVYTFFMANLQLLVMFFGFNLGGSLNYFVANARIPVKNLTGISLILFLISILLGAILLLIPLPFDSLFYASGFDSNFFRLYLLGSFVFALLNGLLVGFLQGKKKFSSINLVTLINAILNFSVFTAVYFLARQGIIVAGLKEIFLLSISVLLINCIFYIVFYYKFVWEGIILFPISKAQLKSLFYFLIPSYISILINFFNYRFLIWVINYYETADQLGYFSLALSFSQMLLMITVAINIVMFPYFSSQKNLTKAKEDLVLVFKVNAYIIAAISLFMFLISAWLIPLFYGKEFLPSVLPFNILVLGTLFLSMAQVFGHFFGAMNKNWLNSILYSIVLLVLSGLSFILVPNYGIIGGAWASTASYILLFVLFTVMAARKFNIIPHSLFSIKNADIKRVKSLYKKFLKKK